MSTNAKQKILIIAYAFKPNKRVGALRADYWYRSIGNNMNCEVSVITGEENANGDRIYVIPKSGSSWLTKFIADAGVVWKKNIQDYLNKIEISSPDVIILTGGPFMHFGLTKWLKSKYGSKVILDYRDLFANNLVFGSSWIKMRIKRHFERRFNRSADALVTVNPYCGKMIEYFDKKPNAIVQNGFDETVPCDPKEITFSEQLLFSYAGKLYFDPTEMQEAFEKSNVKFVYMGPDENRLNLENESINSLGFVDYAKAIDVIGKSDVGIILTTGFEFLSTTKIFDYVRCERAILIISEDKMEEGSVHDELKNYPNVFWAKNTTQSILDAISRIKNATYLKPPMKFAEKYSRAHQLGKLVKLIEEISQ